MEFILSQHKSSERGELYEDETSCSKGLCSHPSCWASHVRESRGFRRYMSAEAGPKQKVDDEESGKSLFY